MQTQLRAGPADESYHGVKLFNISTRELVAAIRKCATMGYQIHQHAREVDMPYRELSLGNIPTGESTEDRERMACFEYGSQAKGTLVAGKLYGLSKHDPFLPVAEDYDHHDEGEERIVSTNGTYYFLAIELLRDPSAVHTVHHDLESFYWVLLWIALRYTAHDRNFTEDPCENIFEFGSDEKAEYAKFGWLGTTRQFTVKGDAPLTDLLRQFKALCKRAILDSGARLIHGDIAGVFNGALARKDWSTDPLRR